MLFLNFKATAFHQERQTSSELKGCVEHLKFTGAKGARW